MGTARRSDPEDDDSDVRNMDAALVEPAAEISIPRRVGAIWVKAEIYEPVDGQPIEIVHKFGAQSQFTTGEIASISADLEVYLPGLVERIVVYQGGYLVMGTDGDRPFSAAGDSGSAVVTGDGRVVGMVVAKEHDPNDPNDPAAYAFVLPIRAILDALEIYLPDFGA